MPLGWDRSAWFRAIPQADLLPSPSMFLQKLLDIKEYEPYPPCLGDTLDTDSLS